MSLRIIKPGVFDTVQDLGRYGFQYLGINPGGAMDRFAAQVSNMLVGNTVDEPVIEIHFPSSTFLFETETMIAIAGGDFSAAINGEDIALWQPVIVEKNSILQFRKWKYGARCYLAVREKLKIEKWLNSYSTNIKAASGGFNGRTLQKDDAVAFREKTDYGRFLRNREFVVLPWVADIAWEHPSAVRVPVVPGREWDLLTPASQKKFFRDPFTISPVADRMGYYLQGKLDVKRQEELVSSAVSFGTIQLLPAGELIILMADHQTTGGYPRVACISWAHLPLLAQKRPGDKIYFHPVDQGKTEQSFYEQEQHLLQLENACNFRLEEFLNGGH